MPHADTNFGKLRHAAIWPALMAAITFAAFLLWRRDVGVVEENHILEWGQGGLLLLAGVVHGVRSRGNVEPVHTIARLGLALFCLSLLLREVDIDKLSTWPHWPTVEWVVRAMMVAAWIAFAIHLIPHFLPLLQHSRRLLLSACGLLTLTGCAMYALSFPFDKAMVPLPANTSRFVEETIQLNATLLLFAAATARLPCLPPTAAWHEEEIKDRK